MSKKKLSSAEKAADESAFAKTSPVAKAMEDKPADKRKKFPAALINYLEAKGISPKILEHKTVYTAIDAANTLKRKMDEIVKTLLIKADNYYYIVCLPANQNMDFKKIQQAIEKAAGHKVRIVQIPSEKVMKELLKLREGGMSAFGSFHNLPVIAEKRLSALAKAVFPSGSFNHSVEMRVKDFLRLENAVLANFGINKKVKLIKSRPPSPIKMKKSANKTMAKRKKKAAKKSKKKGSKKKKR
ncbi:MAG: YbaK/EbsC family protein [Patescibacteria group bacterium]|nr:YbaK/EbsC family protein [Patescibacteria group bacterium]